MDEAHIQHLIRLIQHKKNCIIKANIASHRANLVSEEIRNEAEMIQSMGMRSAAFARWKGTRDDSLTESVAAADVGGSVTSLTKTLRLFLQSAMLGLGAYLVLEGEIAVTGARGMDINLNGAKIDMQKGTLDSNKPVRVWSSTMDIKADAVQVGSNGDRVIFTGDVVINLQPRQKR